MLINLEICYKRVDSLHTDKWYIISAAKINLL
nr:MAG TPA: hypothetical protein [Caudoviricetes sp.]DAI02398.1 MAG TPA: hypothetical protein [Bacteriophage sp.]DAO34278.1 MAG TPA: hypothetical protein [Caudoviricetes sp.]DAU56089.1 MAG TPA: hypothetical protein [Caudoviricetes sp.]DAV89888.1 MAG TPA: hypothetical protein [Caudoviricetes sp.]